MEVIDEQTQDEEDGDDEEDEGEEEEEESESEDEKPKKKKVAPKPKKVAPKPKKKASADSDSGKKRNWFYDVVHFLVQCLRMKYRVII